MSELPIEKNLGKDAVYAIGVLTAQWAHVEALIKIAVVRLTNSNEELMALVAVNHVPFRTLLESLQTLVALHLESHDPEHAEEHAKEFSKLAEKFMAIYERRNLFAHNTLGPGSKPNSIKPEVVKTRRGVVKVSKSEWTPMEIYTISHRMYALVGEFGAFCRKARIDLDMNGGS